MAIMVQARRREDGLDETDHSSWRNSNRTLVFHAELAKRVNLSPTPCYERVRQLERTGELTG